MEEHVTGIKTWFHMWKRCFDYKGTSTRTEYLIPLIIHAVLGVVAAICVVFDLILDAIWAPKPLIVVALIITGVILFYLCISVIPWIALTVRRLRDTGRSGWWAVLLLVVGAGTIYIVAICSIVTSIAVFLPHFNEQPGVYGPPPFDPNMNIQEDVYGPPPMDDEEYEPWTEFDPSLNEEPCVYGPPEMYDDSEDNTFEEDTFEEGTFVPGENVPSAVYGPPEMMD